MQQLACLMHPLMCPNDAQSRSPSGGMHSLQKLWSQCLDMRTNARKDTTAVSHGAGPIHAVGNPLPYQGALNIKPQYPAKFTGEPSENVEEVCFTCKQAGHIASECRTRRQGATARPLAIKYSEVTSHPGPILQHAEQHHAAPHGGTHPGCDQPARVCMWTYH
jgi:hypothetical protein